MRFFTLEKEEAEDSRTLLQGEAKRSDHIDTNLSLDTLQNGFDVSFSDF